MKNVQLRISIKNKLLFFLTCWIILSSLSGIINAEEVHLSSFYVPFYSYTFDYWGDAVEGPAAYLPKKVVSASVIGVDNLKQPKDLVVNHQSNHIYIVDTGNNRIIQLDFDWNVLRIIDHFINDGDVDKFSAPNSLAVSAEQNIYIADTNNARIVQLDQNFNLVKIYTSPHEQRQGVDVFDDNFLYRPTKVGVNEKGHLFILSKDYFDGIITMDADGIFRGIVGAPKVSVSFSDYIWFRLSSDEQKARRNLFLPTEYSSLVVDDFGFIYATVTSEEGEPIRRLNPAGSDSLRRTGLRPPIGDIKYTNMWQQSTYYGRSSFVDVTTLPLGAYSVLDRTRSRVYTYDGDGNLLYAFGYRGRVHGLIARGSTIENMDLDLLVLDDERGHIVVYEPTAYTKSIWDALYHYDKGEYAEAEIIWRQILKQNANYDLAYTGIGRTLLLQKDFAEAMYYFKLGNNRDGYSRAFREYRKNIVEENFTFVMLGIALLVLIIVWRLRTRKETFDTQSSRVAVTSEERWLALSESKRIKDRILKLFHGLKYGLYIIFRPFDGFYELKHRKRGSLASAWTILIGVAITYTLMRQYTGFLFNDNDPSKLNIIVEFASVLLPFGLWVGVNWGFTTLMSGKGTLEEIIIASAYALIPIILINLPLTFISNYLIQEEGAFYYLLVSGAVMWSGLLIFVAMMTTHEYEFGKSLFTVTLTLFGMVFTIFLGLVLMNLVESVTRFINEIFAEVMFRL